MKNMTFTEGKIITPLVSFVFPIMLAMFLQSLYGAVDLLIVGRFSDSENVAAVAVGAQIMMVLTFVITDLSLGTAILLGQFIGEKRLDACGKIIGTTIAMFAVIAVVMSLLMQFAATPVASVLHAPAEAFSQTVSYIKICCAGLVFIISYNVLGSIFRGIGNAKMPLITVAIAALFNVAGDLLLVAKFGMGASGAAIATVAAQAFSVLISLFIIKKTGLPFPFRLADIKFDFSLIKRILSLGVPVCLQDLLVSISFLIIMAIVNTLGVVAAAGIGIAEKLCGFIMLMPSAFSQAMSSFVAQNFGAGKMERAKKALAYGIAISFGCGVVLGYVAFFHGELLSRIFSSDAAVCKSSAEYLKAYGIDCLLTAFLFCFIGFYNGCGRTKFVMLQGIAGAFLVRVPLSFLFNAIFHGSIFCIGLATPSSSLVQILLCVVYMKVGFSKRAKWLETYCNAE